MSRYYILDDIDMTKQHQNVRIIKKHNITLLNIVPKVLEDIIVAYIDDILNFTIFKYDDLNMYGITIEDQYVNYKKITCKLIIKFFNSVNQYCCKPQQFSDNVANINEKHGYIFLLHALCYNMYMHIMYCRHEYFDVKAIRYYHGINHNTITYNDNTLQCGKLKITINNHRLFKNCLVIIKAILNAFNKKLKIQTIK